MAFSDWAKLHSNKIIWEDNNSPHWRVRKPSLDSAKAEQNSAKAFLCWSTMQFVSLHGDSSPHKISLPRFVWHRSCIVAYYDSLRHASGAFVQDGSLASDECVCIVMKTMMSWMWGSKTHPVPCPPKGVGDTPMRISRSGIWVKVIGKVCKVMDPFMTLHAAKSR